MVNHGRSALAELDFGLMSNCGIIIFRFWELSQMPFGLYGAYTTMPEGIGGTELIQFDSIV